VRRGLYPVAAVLGVIASLIVAAPAPVASAKPGYVTYPAERIRQLTIKGTHGFRITVTRISGRVELTASNGNTAAIYVVRSAKNPTDRIQATFPGLGEVSVRFDPSGRAPRAPGGFCGSRPGFRQNGIFRGSIRFEGEQGFTRINVGSAPGSVFGSFKEVCKGSRGSDSEMPPDYLLEEKARSRGGTTVFVAMKSSDALSPDPSARYFASHWERQYGMLSVRVASAQADRDTFATGGSPFRPESATLTPPAPFSGTASFQASPGALAKWEGTLAVELPGIGTVPLTGPQFRPKLCRGQRCVGRD
jgi:hypothetical protein